MDCSLARRNALVIRHRGLVAPIARTLLRRLPPSFDLADLVQAGMIGLIQAASSFDASRGVPFTAFVRQRVRGAMLDSVRRHTYREETHAELEDRAGADPDVVELIERARLRDAVVLLPGREGELVILHYLEGFSLAESGRAVGVSKTRAVQLLRRALTMLRSELSA